MKYYFFILCSSVLFLNSYSQIPAYVPTTDLIAWYPFSGNSLDSSGNGNHLFNNGATPTTDRNGVINSAYSFNGTSNNLTNLIPAFSFGDTSAFTISFWMEKNSATVGAFPYWHGLTQGNGGTNKFCYFMTCGATGNTLWRANKQGSPWINCTSSYAASTWINWTCVYNNQSMKLYKNGVLMSTNTFTYTGTLTATMPFFIGSGSVNNKWFDGKLDDFGIWGRALTPAEVNILYTTCTAPIIGGTITAVSCDSYTSPSGSTYQNTGIYSDTLISSGLCDSIITINLTINYSSVDTITTTNCNSYTSPSGTVYTTTGVFFETTTNVAGCDSNITIDVTIIDGYYITLNEVSCNSYTSPSGKTWTASGTYFDTIPTGTGCDSLYTINLTMNQSTTSTINGSGCDVYNSSNGNSYTVSGTYTETITNTSGCDSVITLNITITNIDTTVTSNGFTLTAVTSGLTYRWLDCDDNYAPISGGNQQNFTPTQNGNYAVKIRDGVCVDTSSCVSVTKVGIDNLDNTSLLKVYPNPARNTIFITNSGKKTTVSILTISGKVIEVIQAQNGVQQYDISKLSAGLYLIKYTSNDNLFMEKLVVE